MDIFQSVLGKRPYGAKCVYHRFDDQVSSECGTLCVFFFEM